MQDTDHKERSLISGEGNILLMDDEDMIRESVGEILESLGYRVTFVRDGAEALTAYKTAKESGHPFDVVITNNQDFNWFSCCQAKSIT